MRNKVYSLIYITTTFIILGFLCWITEGNNFPFRGKLAIIIAFGFLCIGYIVSIKIKND